MTAYPYCSFRFAHDLTVIEENGVRMFLIEGLSQAMLVDTGFGHGDLPSFIRTLTDKPVFVVNTHADKDHIGGNHFFEKIYMHPAEMHRYNEAFPNCISYPLFSDSRLDLGNSCWEIFPLPGHTPGSIALFDRKRGLLIAGDTIQFGPIYMFGSGRSLPAMLSSLIHLQKLSLPISQILPSHSSINLPKDILSQVINAAQALLDGRLKADQPERPLPCKRYQYGHISFYYGE